MSEGTYFLIFYIQTSLSALIAGACFYRYSERSLTIKLMGILFLFSFLCNVLGYLFMILRTNLINIPSSIYDYILVIIASILYNHLTKSKYRTMFTTIVILYFILAFFNLIFFQKESVASYNKLAGSFILISYTLFYFYRLMIELPTVHLQRLPMFWINSAFLLYHAGALFLFAFTDYLINVLKNDMYLYWGFHNILGLIQLTIVMIGVLYDLRTLNQHYDPQS